MIGSVCIRNSHRRHIAYLRTAMNRPRDRQPRPQPRDDSNNNQQWRPRNGGRPRGENRFGGGGGGGAVSVPTMQQVVPGAGVSVVLKKDQPTGRETTGIVQDLLTRGNHPRGIKVRLRDGQVGRVQRMTMLASADDAASATAAAASSPPSAGGRGHPGTRSAVEGTSRSKQRQRYTDIREDDEFPAEPPPRSLADFIPDDPAPAPQARSHTATCPICEAFEGDEVAVSHHVEREHLG